VGCAQQVAELTPRLRTLHGLGVQSIFLSSGDAEFIDEFSRRHKLEDKSVTILTDPSLKVYELANLRRSKWATYGLPAMVGAARAMGRGYVNEKGSGDDTQQGGLLLMDAGNTVRFCYRNKNSADRADSNVVVQIAMGLAAKSVSRDLGRV
jgi:hypothetical protein